MKKIIKMVVFISVIFLLGGCGMNSDNYAERLYQAISQEDQKTFEALLKEGGDVNTLRDERKSSKQGIFRNVLSNSDFENIYPLEIACQKSTQMAYELLEAGADVDVTDPYLNSTPLIYALSSNQPDRFALAMELVQRGADVNHIDDNQRIAVNSAVHILDCDSEETREQSLELVKVLLDQADMNDVIEHSASNPLREAAKYGNCDAIRYILECGFLDINLETDGMTGEIQMPVSCFWKKEQIQKLFPMKAKRHTIMLKKTMTKKLWNY